MSDRTTLVSLLKERASCQADRIAYTFLANGETPEDPLTYRQLDGKAREIASHLQSGISPGEKRREEVKVDLERSHSRLSQIKAFLEYIKNQKSNPKGELRCGKDRRNSGRLRAIAASISRN